MLRPVGIQTNIKEIDFGVVVANNTSESFLLFNEPNVPWKPIDLDASLAKTRQPLEYLHLGDCYTCVPVQKKFRLFNVSQHSLEIQLSTTTPVSSDDVAFESDKIIFEETGVDNFPAATPSLAMSLGRGRGGVRQLILEERKFCDVSFWYCAYEDKVASSPGSDLDDREHVGSSADSKRFTRNSQVISLVLRQFDIFVCSRPLSRDSSELQFVPGMTTKRLKVTARVCTSIVSLSSTQLDFGECHVGSLKQLSLTVHNLSHLPAEIEVKLPPKAVRADTFMTVNPLQKVSMNIGLLSHAIDAEYHSQLILVNRNNPRNEHIIDIRANIIGDHGVSLHSRFYNISASKRSTSNCIQFGSMVAQSAKARFVA
jgi:hypothetical protein